MAAKTPFFVDIYSFHLCKTLSCPGQELEVRSSGTRKARIHSKSFTGVLDAEDVQLAVVQTDAAKHQTVAAQGLDGVDAHAAHHFLQLVIPRGDEVDQALRADIRVEALDQIGTLGRDAPVALAGLAGAAQMAAEGELPDVITFAGNGEPTAAPEFPQAIAGAVALRDELAPNSKIAVLSNGTRADRPEVHDALMMVDDNILKLDTVDPAFIQLLDQPVGPYDVEHQIETFASFDGHVIIQTIFLTGEYQGKPIDNTGEEYVAPWLAVLERIRPQEATIYTVARETPVAGLAKAAPEALDAIAARVRALGIPCQVSY